MIQCTTCKYSIAQKYQKLLNARISVPTSDIASSKLLNIGILVLEKN